MTNAEEKLTTQENWQESVEYAGFYIRMVAMVIDSAAIMLPLSVVFAGLYAIWWGGPNLGEKEMALIMSAQGNPVRTEEVIAQLIAAGHLRRWVMENLIFMLASGGLVVAAWYYLSATPGKMLLGIKLVDADTGHSPSLRQNIIRYLGYFVSILPCMFGFVVVAWDKHKQGWHDKMANTVVVYKRSLPAALIDLTRSKEEA